ncbi:MAG TPA: hypothetical protein VEZ12_01330 [Herpetosiphonaceae bacterium]|nr:hypothetical protein [Herpetosiphonaceae bacterium]
MSAPLTHVANRPAVQHGGVNWDMWRRWTLFTALGELVGFSAPAIAMAAGTVAGWNDTTQVVVAVLAGAVEGAVLGLAQWLALRRYLTTLSGWAWVMATAIGAMAAYLLAMIAVALGGSGPYPIALLAVVGVVFGAGFLVSIGFPQWLVLRHHVPHAGWWISTNAAAWPLGVAVPFIVLALVPNTAAFWVWVVMGIIGGLLMGLLVGAITGVTLVRLLRNQGGAGTPRAAV